MSSWFAVHFDVNAKYLHTGAASSQHMKRDVRSILDYVLLLRGAKQTIWHGLKKTISRSDHIPKKSFSNFENRSIPEVWQLKKSTVTRTHAMRCTA